MYGLTVKDLTTIKALFPFFKDCQLLIESGTYLGSTVFDLERFFKRLITIEIKYDLFMQTKSQYHGNKIHFYFGDSTTILPQLCKKVSEKVIFFLDGHYSHGNTGRGEKDVPLLEELDGINKYCQQDALIVINDARLFGTNEHEDWSEITEKNLLSCLDPERIIKYFTLNDRFIIHLKTNI